MDRRPARALAVARRQPTPGRRTATLTSTSTLPLRPSAASVARQRTSAAPLTRAMGLAGAHTSSAMPMRPAAARAARSAADSARWRASTAPARSETATATRSTRAEHASTHTLAEPRSPRPPTRLKAGRRSRRECLRPVRPPRPRARRQPPTDRVHDNPHPGRHAIARTGDHHRRPGSRRRSQPRPGHGIATRRRPGRLAGSVGRAHSLAGDRDGAERYTHQDHQHRQHGGELGGDHPGVRAKARTLAPPQIACKADWMIELSADCTALLRTIL